MFLFQTKNLTEEFTLFYIKFNDLFDLRVKEFCSHIFIGFVLYILSLGYRVCVCLKDLKVNIKILGVQSSKKMVEGYRPDLGYFTLVKYSC